VRRSSGWLRLLWPFSVLYSTIVRTKAWCYSRGVFRKQELKGTVISVGNITLGGTGKTPMVLWIAERLAREGKRAAILTRGYRGRQSADSQGLPQSDEVAMLRERLGGHVQLGVGSDRRKSGEALASHGVEWFVLDDGFQYLRLVRDADIVLVDLTNPFGRGMVLPAGHLREPVSSIRRADIVVITRSVQPPSLALESLIRRHTECPIFYAGAKLDSVLRFPRLDVALPRQDFEQARFLAFCGIGNAGAFFEDLRGWGFQIVAERSFPDHHVYNSREAGELEEAAAKVSADALLCTEKDVWNLRHVQFVRIPVYCCRISFVLPEEFWTVLMETVGSGRKVATQ
jgi:tetraacyldisaccharide 4'-kinase